MLPLAGVQLILVRRPALALSRSVSPCSASLAARLLDAALARYRLACATLRLFGASQQHPEVAASPFALGFNELALDFQLPLEVALAQSHLVVRRRRGASIIRSRRSRRRRRSPPPPHSHAPLRGRAPSLRRIVDAAA